MKNKMYLVLGDWSNDGHEKSEKILLESNVAVREVQKAYKAACKLTSVSFHDDGIACEYENTAIPAQEYKKLEKFGIGKLFDKEYLELYLGEDGSVGIEDVDKYIEIWIWFVKLGNPEITLVEIDEKDDIPIINGYWDKFLNESFGYGLYD